MTIPNRLSSHRNCYYCDAHHRVSACSGSGRRHAIVRSVMAQEDFTSIRSRMDEWTLTQAVGKCLPGAVKSDRLTSLKGDPGCVPDVAMPAIELKQISGFAA